MGAANGVGQRVGRLAGNVEQFARWWTSASKEERFRALKASIETNTPPLQTVRFAIILAECEAGEISEG